MSNNKTQIEVQNTEAQSNETTEVMVAETKQNVFKTFGHKVANTKGGQWIKKHKVAVTAGVTTVAVAGAVAFLGSDFGKKKGLQDNHQEYVEGEFTEELENESTDEGSEEIEGLLTELDKLEGSEEN